MYFQNIPGGQEKICGERPRETIRISVLDEIFSITLFPPGPKIRREQRLVHGMRQDRRSGDEARHSDRRGRSSSKYNRIRRQNLGRRLRRGQRKDERNHGNSQSSHDQAVQPALDNGVKSNEENERSRGSRSEKRAEAERQRGRPGEARGGPRGQKEANPKQNHVRRPGCGR